MTAYDPTGALLEAPTEPLAKVPTMPETMRAAPAEEPTGGAILAERAPAVPELAPAPPIPLPLPLRNVSGTYVGVSGNFELDLRVDVDGRRPIHKVSGDFVSISGSTRTYFGSFIVESPTVTSSPAGEVIRGLGRFTFSAGAPVVQVTIPRRIVFQPAAPATVQFFTIANQPGAIYVCNYSSAYFRTVSLQTEIVSNVVGAPFSSYDTSLLPSGGPARTLSVVSAYAEAAIQMTPMAAGPVIDINEAGANHLWSDAELMASMQRHFTRYATAPHWDLWQVVCWQHEIGPGLYGIMFDTNGRQGCAVFYLGIGGATPTQHRLQLYTHVHELGHCFNLMHSWQKSLARPPGVDNPSALSWMNYPWNYPGGANAFWNAFPFQFADEELVHLRHAFRNNIIPVANPFTIGAAEIDPEVMSDPIEDLSGLEFAISAAQPSHYLGEPVVLNLRLRSFDKRGRIVHANLHPSTSGVSIAIARPDGRALRFDPLVDHLVSAEPQLLPASEELTESAYIGFGKGGLYFDRPGTYRVRAIYHAPDGSRVLSNVASLRIRHPATTEDNEIAELMIGEEQGALFALLGSDADSLSQGNAALDTVIAKHAKHPLATYARFVKGVNAARAFKTVDSAVPSRLRVRKPDLTTSQTLLSAATAGTSRLDDISKVQGLERLAVAQHASGETAAAAQTRQLSQGLRAASRR
jgi:hypothetical protein